MLVKKKACSGVSLASPATIGTTSRMATTIAPTQKTATSSKAYPADAKTPVQPTINGGLAITTTSATTNGTGTVASSGSWPATTQDKHAHSNTHENMHTNTPSSTDVGAGTSTGVGRAKAALDTASTAFSEAGCDMDASTRQCAVLTASVHKATQEYNTAAKSAANASTTAVPESKVDTKEATEDDSSSSGLIGIAFGAVVLVLCVVAVVGYKMKHNRGDNFNHGARATTHNPAYAPAPLNGIGIGHTQTPSVGEGGHAQQLSRAGTVTMDKHRGPLLNLEGVTTHDNNGLSPAVFKSGKDGAVRMESVRRNNPSFQI